MGKTFRYDPESRTTLRKIKNHHCNSGKTKSVQVELDYEGWNPVTQSIDEDWAISKMSSRISFVVSSLIAEELILQSERQDYISRYNLQIIKLLGQYDPSRVGETGESASPLHYLRMIERGLTANIRDYAKYRRDNFSFTTVVATKDEAMENPGALYVNDKRMSDDCKNVKQLDLRLDIRTLSEMLTFEERLCLARRIEGYTQEEIAEELESVTRRPCDRDRVRKVLMIHIQNKARACGFYPPSEQKKI